LILEPCIDGQQGFAYRPKRKNPDSGIQDMKKCWLTDKRIIFLGCAGMAIFALQTTTVSATDSVCIKDNVATLSYSSTNKARDVVVPVKAADGADAYFLILSADPDVYHNPISLELILSRSPSLKKDDFDNLFDPTGHVMGYQPYTFAASDFLKGAAKSIGGSNRSLYLRDLGIAVHIKVMGANVYKTNEPRRVGTYDYAFDNLSLEVSTSNLHKCD
jgi:hypothetical protein